MEFIGKDTTYSAVYDTFDNVDNKDELKFFCFPMRTGKTFLTINNFVPYLFSETNLNWIILTSPLNGIINQNELELICSADDNGFIYEDELHKVIRLLKSGRKVVSYLSNAKAFKQIKPLFNKIDLSRVGLFIDEADYGSTDCAESLMENKAYSCSEYKGSMYRFAKELARYSTHTYALTATPSFQVKNLFPTLGSLTYKIYQNMQPGEQKVFAPRVGWAGEAHFFPCVENPLFRESDETEEYILKMLQAMVDVEKMTGLKRSCIIQIQDADEKYNEEAVRKVITSPKAQKILRPIIVSDEDDFAGVMNSNTVYRINLRNIEIFPKSKEVKQESEMNIFDDIDDQDAPMRVILVKMMAGRGVTLKTVKEVMTLKRSNPVTRHGHPTESAIQFIGRGKTIYPGTVEVSDLYDTYDADITNIWKDQFPNKMINTYRYWAPNVDKNIKAWENHLENDACTFDMLDWDMVEQCPCCGRALPSNVVEISYDPETLDKALNIAA